MAYVQESGPEILVASLSEPAIRHVSGWADGIAGFSFGPTIEEIETTFERARKFWAESGRNTKPRLVTSFWFALGSNAREQLDTYLHRYLDFLGDRAAVALARSVKTDSPQALRDMVRRVEDTGADELSLVPTTCDPDELARVAEALGR